MEKEAGKKMMRILVLLQLKDQIAKQRRCAQCGFTLIEMLVVMLLLGLMASVALPNLEKMVQSIALANNKQKILTALLELPIRAHYMGKPIYLNENNFIALAADEEKILDVPDGWQVKITPPVTYDFNGFCTGGRVTLLGPDDISEIYIITPPFCRLQADE
jgi:prepilin-type N-terminal cleavage/methylation domain-containing protein